MNASRTTRTFKSGNSEAIRLPKGLGFGIGTDLTIERRGNEVVLRPVQDAEAARAVNRELIRRLREIGPVGEIEKREPIEFPDRPGLY